MEQQGTEELDGEELASTIAFFKKHIVSSDRVCSSSVESKKRSPNVNAYLGENSSNRMEDLTKDALQVQHQFVIVKKQDSMDVRVGYGGLNVLHDHIQRGYIDSESILTFEFEFCTHGFDGASNGCEYYWHYLRICDAIEAAFSPRWRGSFVIRRGRPRLGAFEVMLIWTACGDLYSFSLFSKLASRRLPSAEEDLLPRLAQALLAPLPPALALDTPPAQPAASPRGDVTAAA